MMNETDEQLPPTLAQLIQTSQDKLCRLLYMVICL